MPRSDQQALQRAEDKGVCCTLQNSWSRSKAFVQHTVGMLCIYSKAVRCEPSKFRLCKQASQKLPAYSLGENSGSKPTIL
ncbi:hypothetical protein BVRB_7g158720 [Beta vulgaris subsp. vulgaris]|nr:hypothetical protein BVRB_7g158720 [Beta vulgaris subsp. vulgaris]